MPIAFQRRLSKRLTGNDPVTVSGGKLLRLSSQQHPARSGEPQKAQHIRPAALVMFTGLAVGRCSIVQQNRKENLP